MFRSFFLMLVSLTLFTSCAKQSADKTPFASFVRSTAQKKIDVLVGGKPFQIELAKSTQEQRIGLSKFNELAPDAGMLFIYEMPIHHRFWMKGMHFPIDILWISGNTIVEITSDVPMAEAHLPLSQLKQYSSTDAVDFVLELNAGTTQKMGIRIGDTLSIIN